MALRNPILALEEARLNGDRSLLGSCQKELTEQYNEHVKPKLTAGLAGRNVSHCSISNLNLALGATLWSEWLPGYGDR